MDEWLCVLRPRLLPPHFRSLEMSSTHTVSHVSLLVRFVLTRCMSSLHSSRQVPRGTRALGLHDQGLRCALLWMQLHTRTSCVASTAFERFLQIARHLERELGVTQPSILGEWVAEQQDTSKSILESKAESDAKAQQKRLPPKLSASVRQYAVDLHRSCQSKRAESVEDAPKQDSCVLS